MVFTVRKTPIEITRRTILMGLIGLAIFTFGGYDFVQQSMAVDNAEPVDATIVDSSLPMTKGSQLNSPWKTLESTGRHGNESSPN